MWTRPLIVASALALLAACGPATPPEPESTEPPAGLATGSFDLEVDGRTIHYEVHGAGPVVMVVPNSWGLSLAGLRGMFGSLERDLTLVYFDPRGMGGSSPVVEEADMGLEAVRADFHALREHLGLERVHAMGWSNGAMNLILLAEERPETLSSAVFVHGAAAFTAEDMQRFAVDHPELMQRWMAVSQELQTLEEPERTTRQKAFWLEEYFPAASADPEGVKPALQAAFADARFSWAHSDYTERAYPTFDARDRLASIPVPSLVMAGRADMMPPELVQELADGLPDAELVVFEHSGHFAPLEEPDRFREVVLEFLGVTGSGPPEG